MLKKLILLLVVLSLISCSFPKPKPGIFLDPDTAIVALVLGEGIAKSFAHVGVIKALEEAKIPIHLVIGSGMGSLMGALYANKRKANDLEWHAMAFKQEDYFDYSLLKTSGLISGSRLTKFLLDRLVHTKIEDLPIPFVVATTDLKTGTSFLFEKGPIIEAVHGGIAIPGIFTPVDYDRKLLVSGEISRGLPVDVAIQKGADLIIAVDLTQGIERYRFGKTQDVTLQSYKITSASLSQEQLKKAHIVIQPKVSHIDFLDFSRKREAMIAGYEATREVIPKLREILSLEEED